MTLFCYVVYRIIESGNQNGFTVTPPVLLKVWSTAQEHQHYVGACEKYNLRPHPRLPELEICMLRSSGDSCAPSGVRPWPSQVLSFLQQTCLEELYIEHTLHDTTKNNTQLLHARRLV